MTAKWWLVLAVVVAACKGGARSSSKSSADGASTAGSASPAQVHAAAAPVAVADAVGAAADTPSIDASLDDPRSAAARCAHACLYLLDVPLAEAREAFARDCKATWPYAADDCDGLLYARNCIYAGFGNVFKRPEWKQRFETQPWYRAKPGFQERDFSPVARANVRALVAASKACKQPPPKVTSGDIALATTAYDKLRQGERVPAADMSDEDLRAFESKYGIYGIVDKTEFEYAELHNPADGHRAISIGGLMYMAGPGTFEADVAVTLVFDDQNRLIEAY